VSKIRDDELIMEPIIFVVISILLMATTFRRFTLLKLFNGIWFFVLALYFLGPLHYKVEANTYIWLMYLLTWVLSFNFGYMFTYSLVCPKYLWLTSDRSHISTYKWLGVLGSIMWVSGGLIYSIPYIITLDFYSLRISFVGGEGDISLFSKLGSILAGFVFFGVTRKYYKSSDITFLESTSIVLLLLVPIFMAGRQIYLQLLLLVSFSLFLSARLESHSRILRYVFLRITRDRLTVVLLILAIVGAVAMTLLRLGGADLVLYGSRLELYSATSSAQLREGYAEIYYNLPSAIQDLIIEFTYYFSAQIAKFAEFFSLNVNVSILGFGVLEKSLFIKSNIEKIGNLLGYHEIFRSRGLEDFLGYMPASAWGTVAQSNVYLYGTIGACLVNIISGFICALSQSSVLRGPVNYSSYNFYVANCVLIFYSISESVLNEVYFLIYYVISFMYFLHGVKFKFWHSDQSMNAKIGKRYRGDFK
jgi:hypothetical protein